MRILVWIVVAFVAAAIFAASNIERVTVQIWQVPIYTGPLAVALIASGFLGALIMFLASLMFQAGLRAQVHELEEKVREQGDRLAGLPAWAQGRPSPRPPQDTRPFP
jgi:uncharacterized integral membrane protein